MNDLQKIVKKGNTVVHALISRAPSHTIESLVTPLLALTSLADKAHLYPSELTAGQKQKVAIAGVLVLQPKVLLCDEATPGLDAKVKHSILQLLNESKTESDPITYYA